MSKHRIHLEDKIHSKEQMVHSVKVLQALKDLKDFLSSLEGAKEQGDLPSVTFLMNLRRCLVKKEEADKEARYRQKVKTSC